MPDIPLLADIHISPLTCNGLRAAGYTVARVSEVLSTRSRDAEIIRCAQDHGYVIVTQDLDFTAHELQRVVPDVSIDLIRRILRRLRQSGRLACTGRGPDARWRHLGTVRNN